MDDARIRQLTEEVLSQLRSRAPEGADLEARVAALEAAVRELQAGRVVAPAGGVSAAAREPAAAAPVSVVHVQVDAHPSLQVLNVPARPEGGCVLEPDKPCVQSGQCRAMGH
jgi:hypothetical protein